MKGNGGFGNSKGGPGLVNSSKGIRMGIWINIC